MFVGFGLFDLAWNPNGSTLASCHFDAVAPLVVSLLDVQLGQVIALNDDTLRHGIVDGVAWSRCGTLLAIAGRFDAGCRYLSSCQRRQSLFYIALAICGTFYVSLFFLVRWMSRFLSVSFFGIC